MEWWKFNGYGFFVWGSYLTALAVVVIENALLAVRHRNARLQVEELEYAEPAAQRDPANKWEAR
jgi:heme exporter protein CcmD